MLTDDTTGIDPDLLPTQLRLLIQVIGVAETILLVQKCGNRRIRMPLHGERDNEIATVLKPDSVIKLCSSDFRGKRLTLPKADSIVKQLRNMAVAALRGKQNKATVAQQFDLHQRQVQRIWNDCEDDDPTLDLFS